MKLVLEHDGETFPVRVEAVEDRFTVSFEDKTYDIHVRGLDNGGGAISFLVGNESVEAWTIANGNRYDVSVLGQTFDIEVEDALRASLKEIEAAAGGAAEETILAPMPGVVVEHTVGEGDVVEAGQAVVIVEAMKMRNEFGPKRGGRVAKLLVDVGKSVERGQALAVIVQDPEGDES